MRYAFILFILSMVFIFGLVYIDHYFIDNIESFTTLIFYLPVNILFAVISLMALYYSAFHCRDTKEWSKPLKEIVLSFKILPFIIPPTMFIFFIARFHEVFTFPIELKNVEYLVCKMEKIDESANIELLYSNDKYIFIRCDVFTKDWKGKPRTNEIRIFQFEELFDDTACDGSKRIRAQFVKDSIWDSKLPKVLKDTYARDSKSIEALKKYADSYIPNKIDLSDNDSMNDYNIEFIMFADKYANHKILKDEITNIFLLKLYLFHLTNSHQGYDLLSMRKGQTQFVIDYFIKSNNIENDIEMLNSGYPYILLSKSEHQNSKQIQDLIIKIKKLNGN